MQEGSRGRQGAYGRIQNYRKVSSGIIVILYFSSNLGDYISKHKFLCISCEVNENCYSDN